ncbi:hypothetical protein ACSTIQ_00195, partial [Vibrio parahaemolyticus]
VMLVEWSYGPALLAQSAGLAPAPGVAELLQGTAGFEEAITALPGSECHFIASGNGLARAAAAVDPDLLNLVLDALDEAYAHIVVAD